MFMTAVSCHSLSFVDVRSMQTTRWTPHHPVGVRRTDVLRYHTQEGNVIRAKRVSPVVCAMTMDTRERTSWVSVERNTTSSRYIIDRFFGTNISDIQTSEVFLTEGVPCAAILYSSVNSDGMPVVDTILMNEGLLLLFDVGPVMRRSLYEKYGCISIQNATNCLRFLTC
jgi:hypothetical protein